MCCILEVVNVDVIRLRQVFFNLPENVTKFTNNGEVRLLVSATESIADKVLLHCVVEDSGLELRESGKIRFLARLLKQ